ncbi:MAG TPA: hypothetical protein VGM86_17545 [Thermoanaerobaculia bacterium]|jgi:hypothetical protein
MAISKLFLGGLMFASTLFAGQDAIEQDLPEQNPAPAEVELEGALVLTPVMSRTTDSPEFQVRFTSHSKTTVEAPVLQEREGILLDGQEISQLGYVWIGIVPLIHPGSHYDYHVSSGSFLPGKRKSFSKTLGQWRWLIHLSSGPHRVVYFLRKASAANSARIESNEVLFIWDDSQPLLYEASDSEAPCSPPN